MSPSGSKERERTFQPEIVLFTDRDPRVPYDAANRTGLLLLEAGLPVRRKRCQMNWPTITPMISFTKLVNIEKRARHLNIYLERGI